MEEEIIKQLTLSDIVRWIVENSDDEASMDKINKLTFSFTSKYKRYTEADNG
jgi:hypothetical protein